MQQLTIGKIRGLQQIATTDGIFTMCAMDHRGSMLRMINETKPESVSFETMVERKLELCIAMGKYSSAVLLDPIYGAAQALSRGTLPKDTGLLVSVEATGYEGGKENRLTKLLDGWNVEKVKRMGASAVKILVYYRPDSAASRRQLDTVNKVAQECIKYDIPFLVEPVSYAVGSEVNNPRQFAEKKGELVIKTARDMTTLPVDVLKAEFPADLRFESDDARLSKICRKLDASSQVPWVILSAGVDFEMFSKQVEIACKAGASGFLGGRAIWQEAMQIGDTRERVKYIETVGVDRLKRLVDMATRYATPWYKKAGLSADELVEISPEWYREY